MKIGVTGSDHICDRIQKTLEKRMPDQKWSTGVPTITGTVWKRLPSFRRESIRHYFYWADQLSLCFKAAGAKRSLDLSSALIRLPSQKRWQNLLSVIPACRMSSVYDMYEEQLVRERWKRSAFPMAASLWQ